MTHYISADVRRVLRKPSFRGAVGAFAALFAVLVFIYVDPSFTAEMYLAKVTGFLGFFPLGIGVFVFMSVYADDFKCQSMQTAIGYGIPRSGIVLAKLLEGALLLFGVAAIMALLVAGTPVVLGLAPNARQLASLALSVAVEALRALGYLALSAVPAFLLQDAIGGIIAYVLLSSKTVYIVLTLILGQAIWVETIGDLTKALYTAQLYALKDGLMRGDPFILPLAVALLLYMALPTAIAVMGFRRKELAF